MNERAKVLSLEYRFMPKTGSKKPHEVWGRWSHGAFTWIANYKTEEAARLHIEKWNAK